MRRAGKVQDADNAAPVPRVVADGEISPWVLVWDSGRLHKHNWWGWLYAFGICVYLLSLAGSVYLLVWLTA